MLYYYAAYLLVMNLIGLIMMGWDKGRAKAGAWRIPEKTLFLIAALGGCFGGWAGMYLFRHKTRHMSFVFGFSVLALLHAGLAIYLFT